MAVLRLLAGALFWVALWLSAGRVPSTLTLSLSNGLGGTAQVRYSVTGGRA